MTKKNDKLEIPSDIQKLSFEEGLLELEKIITQLEDGRVTLDESIDIYTRGSQLRVHCESKLKSAKEKIEKIIPLEDGSIESESVEID
ncbi:MAG: Exodeoxyribonuclease 7 small subunit [Alphaproteobacteria bacterium MarineAlpha2_Bin1]|nr:MAG: Exodeoxyribonuclease 7 small subunit [Alphaproteobacteria bacterium MarineAlpha2_Bin1]|tara:strand:- start:2044 stop:2307 length:264 start_codon:yes stop_codon:yes gene_type:complete